jgi:2-deoxy-D-gluconate 3-dehydrogenase
MDLGLAAKVAIVTGASRGLGRAAATALATEGAHVLAAARSADALTELAGAHPGAIVAVQVDLRDRERVAALPQQALDRFGRLDIIVNNAGIAPATPFADQDWQAWDDVLAIFEQQGSGKIINIASTSGLRGKPLLAAYSASKGALVRFTEALAAEWAPVGIQVNAIAPGAFVTDAQRAVTSDEQLLARRIRKIPARRMGDPDEFGAMVAFLASPLSDFVSGATFVIDGGEVGKL